MNWITVLGIFAGCISVVSFIPQVIKIVRTKNTKSISLLMYIIFCSGILVWIVYGFLVEDLPVILTNILIGIQAFTILVFKIKYK